MTKKITDKVLIKFIKEGYERQETLLRSFWRENKNKKGHYVFSDKGELPSEWTKLTENVFCLIARKFYFSVEPEVPMTKQRRIDYVWYGENNEAIVAIESENTSKFDVVRNEEWSKLLEFKSNYKILIFYKWEYNDKEEWNKIICELQKSIDKNAKLRKECFIIISMWIYKDSKETHWKVSKLRKGRRRQSSGFKV